MKILLLFALISIIHTTQSATLRRKPKVYNALITTDQNLTPSRAYPVIQPHLQETYAYPSYSYRSFAPFGFHYGSGAAASIGTYNGFHGHLRPYQGAVEARNFFPRDEISTLPPIPLNSFGLQPSIIPVNSFAYGHTLAPYPYSSYPLTFDQFGGYGSSNPLLPPFSFYPLDLDGSGNNADKGKGNEKPKNDDAKSDDGGGDGGSSNSSGSSSGSSNSGGSGSSNSGGSGSSNSGGSGSSTSGGGGGSGSSSGSSGSTTNSGSSSSSSSSTKSARARNFDKPEPELQLLSENVKNFANKDRNIPDVPPPPLPSGAKAVEN